MGARATSFHSIQDGVPVTNSKGEGPTETKRKGVELVFWEAIITALLLYLWAKPEGK